MKIILTLVAALSLIFSFDVFAMQGISNKSYDSENYGFEIPTPSKDSDYQFRYRWTWLNDDLCIQFQANEVKTAKITRDFLKGKCDAGLITRWYDGSDPQKRDSYTGKWSQAEDGIWAFIFDDSTIPIDLTRIDGVLYAFNGYGELVDGYKYWNDYKTGPDGLVTCTEPEFLAYLETQYIPDCTSHE